MSAETDELANAVVVDARWYRCMTRRERERGWSGAATRGNGNNPAPEPSEGLIAVRHHQSLLGRHSHVVVVVVVADWGSVDDHLGWHHD